jgi:MtN3 and saliva related transmembrane protein
MTSAAIETVGSAAALVTTLCWVPQAVRTIRTRDTRAISLWTQVGFDLGLAL